MTRGLAIAGLAVAATVGSAAAQSYTTVNESRRLDNTEPMAVKVEFAVGRFQLRPATRTQLYHVSLTYADDAFQPEIVYRPEGRTLDIGLAGHGHGDSKDFDDNRQRLDVALSPAVPLDLDLQFGAIKADLEFGDLSVRRAHIKTGASETTIGFSAPNRIQCETLELEVGAADFEATQLGNSRCRLISLKGAVGQMTLDFTGDWVAGSDTKVSVSVGLGEVRLRLPDQLGVRFNVDRFLAKVDRSSFIKRGSAYYSRNYDSAATKIDIDVGAAFGNIEVDWVH
jgi:hypothetical protein